MTERAVPDIVQHDGDRSSEGLFVRDRVSLTTERGYGLAHEMHGPQCMVEACVECARIHQMAEPELFDVT